MKKYYLYLVLAFLLFGIIPSLIADNAVHSTEKGMNQSNVVIKKGIISANLMEALLWKVLKDIESQGTVRIVMDESISQEKVTVAFHGLPLEEGLKRILTSMNYSLFYDQDNRVSEVVILGKKGFSNKVSGSKAISSEGIIAPDSRKDQTGSLEPLEVIENAPPGGGVESTPVKDENFKVIKNLPPPGGPVEMTEEELGHFKVLPNSPPP